MPAIDNKLDVGDVHLWSGFFMPDLSQSQQAHLISELSDQERRKFRRFSASAVNRLNYLQTRVFVRYVLSHYVQSPATKISFCRNVHGKPMLSDQSEKIKFNLSHSKQLLAIAVSRDLVGLDVEKKETNRNIEAIALRYFPKQALDDFLLQPSAKQVSCFFKYWTMLEACTKCLGVGLSYPVSKMTFCQRPPKQLSYCVTLPPYEDNPCNDLQVKFQTLDPNFLTCVALANNQNDMNVIHKEISMLEIIQCV